MLGQFVTRSDVARRTLQEVATSDPDLLLRRAATAVLTNGHTRSRKALEADPFNSDGHRRLISALDRAGQHGAARQARDRYSEHMRELGINDA